MKISYLILAHKNPTQFQRLVEKLNTEDVYFFVHVDKSTDDTPFKEPFLNFHNIFFLEDHERRISSWSDITICEATLSLLKKTTDKINSNNYCVLLSGQDYPIKNNNYISNFFKSHYGLNFISVSDITDIWPEWKDRFERYNFHHPEKRLNRGIYPITDKRFFNIRNFKHAFYLFKNVGIATTLNSFFKRKRQHPDYLIPKGGSTWWALPVETVVEILDYLKVHPDFLTYHKYTHVPDETFFTSIVNELKDKDEIKETTTYANWLKENVELPVTFGKNDLQELLRAGDNSLFARKFDISFDTEIMDKLDENNSISESSYIS